MSRVDCILGNQAFVDYLEKNRYAETGRVFCRHDITHMLDVCRVAWILNLEGGYGLDRELVYAAGLLHDIGRWLECETGCDHAAASGALAADILTDCGFLRAEQDDIVEAILAHRQGGSAPLASLLYEADKISRPCFCCSARPDCKRFENGAFPIFRY